MNEHRAHCSCRCCAQVSNGHWHNHMMPHAMRLVTKHKAVIVQAAKEKAAAEAKEKEKAAAAAKEQEKAAAATKEQEEDKTTAEEQAASAAEKVWRRADPPHSARPTPCAFSRVHC